MRNTKFTARIAFDTRKALINEFDECARRTSNQIRIFHCRARLSAVLALKFGANEQTESGAKKKRKLTRRSELKSFLSGFTILMV